MHDNELKSVAKKNYKSPIGKLTKFFEKSRDKWKSKYLDAKYAIKLLKNQVQYLEKRKAELKLRVKELEKQQHQSELKKKDITEKAIDTKFNLVPAQHTYSIDHMYLLIRFVFSGCTSMRGSSRIFDLISSFLELGQPSPSWYSVRFWILRLGYFKLERAKEQADDWIWIVDHTVQLGIEKCLVILGIRQSLLPSSGLHISHEDVETIAMMPVTHSNGEVVYEQLTKSINKTGVPMAIVADHGPDIKSGIERFCREHTHTCYLYDIKHKTASILKRELQNDPDWKQFSKNAAQTSKKVQQTSLSAFASPNQRSKARYMNVDILVKWGQDMLCYLDQQQIEPSGGYDTEQIQEKIGWLNEYRDQLSDWQKLIHMMKIAESHIKYHGIYRDCHIDLKKELDNCPNSATVDRVREELVSFAKEQSLNAVGDERLLGSSEVIESVFGKFKTIEHDQAKSGFTSMLLGLPALLSKTTQDIVKQAMETVPTKKVIEWFKENIGQSVQSKRKEILKMANI